MVEFVHDSTVRVTRVEGNDLDIALGAWVSTKGERAEDEADPKRVAGLINFLLRERHGTPFELCGLMFLTTTPLFVWEQHIRHRIMSVNRESARYSELKPVFYVPDIDRPLVQEGKPGTYTFVRGTWEQMTWTQGRIKAASLAAYRQYLTMLEDGVAKEVARMVLPVNTMSSGYVRFNLRSLMNFLSLRTEHEDATFPSHPQYEIVQVAVKYEKAFKENFPITYEAYVNNGRVAP